MVDALRAAAMWGIPPLEFYQLDPRNQGLMEGYALFEQSLRPHGYPDWVAEDPDNMGRFEVKERQDFAQEVLDVEAQIPGKKLGPGMRRYVAYTPPKPLAE